MGFIIDTIFSTLSTIDDIKLNIQDSWYEQKFNHYIKKYNEETGQYPRNVLTKENENWRFPQHTYNRPCMPTKYIIDPTQLQYRQDDCNKEVETDQSDDVEKVTGEVIETITSDEETDQLVNNVDTEKAVEIPVVITEVKENNPVKETSTDSKQNVETEVVEKSSCTVDPAEKEFPKEDVDENKEYINVKEKLAGKTEHMETAKMLAKEQKDIDDILMTNVNNIVGQQKANSAKTTSSTKTTTKRSTSKRK